MSWFDHPFTCAARMRGLRFLVCDGTLISGRGGLLILSHESLVRRKFGVDRSLVGHDWRVTRSRPWVNRYYVRDRRRNWRPAVAAITVILSGAGPGLDTLGLSARTYLSPVLSTMTVDPSSQPTVLSCRRTAMPVTRRRAFIAGSRAYWVCRAYLPPLQLLPRIASTVPTAKDPPSGPAVP